MIRILYFLFLFNLVNVGFSQPKVLIAEDFSSVSRGWPLDEANELRDGKYLINSNEDGDESLISFYVDYQNEFELSVDFIFQKGAENSAYGLAWGVGTEDYNVFLITPDGQFTIHSGALSLVKGWKKSTAIRAGGQVNTLKIVSSATRVTGYINGEKMEERKAMPGFGSYTGILLLSEASVSVDNFSFRQNQTIRVKEGAEKFDKKENLGPGVNSKGDELGPLISADGKTIYFSRQHVAENIGGVDDPEDIWISRMEGGNWGNSRNMGRSVNTSLSDNLVAVSADNNSIVFETSEGMVIRHREGSGWSLPEKMGFTFRNETDHVVACLSADGKAIIFSAKEKGNVFYDTKRDESDLYVSVKTNGKWGSPVNLGKTINTAGEETSPFLSADGNTLYFATNGRPGFGDQDIFAATRMGTGWTSWSEPENLGPAVNTPFFDAYYTVPASSEYAYFVSYANSFGEGDIFRIKLHPEARPQAVILVRGKVVNSKSKEPLAATIHFENLGTGIEVGEARTDPHTGAYQIIMPFGLNYGLKARADGYYAIHENLELLQASAYQEIDRDLLMVPIEVGATVKLNNIFFEPGSATLKTESYPELTNLISFLKDNPGISIELDGHTDNLGDEATLLKLSMDRVTSVKTYLTEKGIDAKRIDGKGFGASHPVAPSNSEENRKLNRRVEFKITKK